MQLRRALALFLVLALAASASAQLAITEVMAEAAGDVTPKRPDFWELTNFGSNRIDLTTYRWMDSAGIEAAEPTFFAGRSIDPGETILLVRSNVVTTLTRAQVVDWWGANRLPAQLQVLFYRGPGFSPDYDAVQLWRVSGGSTTLVDRVEFYAATPGATFTYSPDTGEFDAISRDGLDGAFRAAQGTDVGSPGRTVGPVPLRISTAPVSVEVDAGAPATFAVQARGLPKPRYQWRRNGLPIAGATDSTLTLPNVVASDAGNFTVELNNGLETLISDSAELRVNTALSCARLIRPPASLEVTPGQVATFSVQARGFPLPVYQWQIGDQSIAGATNATFSIQVFSAAQSGVISVVVANSLCSTQAYATLTVSPPPDLRVTEVMAAASTNATLRTHRDWWELTNFGTNAVSLRGYRFDDTPGVLSGAVTITNDVVLQPGESVVLISDATPAEFVRWWGEENLPGNLQIIAYAGNSFDSLGDSLFLWNATANARDDVITSISFVNDMRGVSLWFDSGLAEFGLPSVEGERGAFRAVEADDIGSPGWITNPPPRVVRPKFVSIVREGEGVTLTWKTKPGQIYEVQACQDLALGDWVSWRVLSAEGATLSISDPLGTGTGRYYRLVARPISP